VAAAADLTVYTDAGDISPWAWPAMQWAGAEGLMTGMTQATLEPSGGAARAQVATIFMRFAENVANS
jgi:hypothetical protein